MTNIAQEMWPTQDAFNISLDKALSGSRIEQGKFKEAVLAGRKMTVQEAITSDVLAPYFNAAVAPEFEAEYAEYPQVWSTFASETQLNDFRPLELRSLEPDSTALLQDNGGYVAPAETLPAIPELTPYPTFGWKGAGKWIETGKYGARMQFSWEAFVNDEWDIIEQFPTEAARLAARTIDAAVFGQIWSIDPRTPGFNTSNISDANGTVLKARQADNVLISTNVPKNAPLSYDSLKAAIQQAAESENNGRPVVVPSFVLLVPPNLKPLADMLVNTRTIERTVNTDTGTYKFVEENGLPASVTVVMSDLPLIMGGTHGRTNWALVPAGGRTAARRTIVKTALRGYDQPELRVKNATGERLGGGSIPYTEGSFDNDDAEARVRITAGSGILNYDGIVCSTGAGA